MVSVGIDIGTTTICACVLDAQTGSVLKTWTQQHAFLLSNDPWAKIQNVKEIEETAQQILDQIVDSYPQIACLGMTGQMHGILYLDEKGSPLSPLMTWQDERGNLLVPEENETYAQRLTRLTGYPCATGYGAVTHYYNVCNGLVPKGAACFCTIHDYLMMKFGQLSRPVTHPSDAASFGLFQVGLGQFDVQAIETAGMDPAIFPEVSANATAETKYGFPVAVAIGDNQACFHGSVRDPEQSALVNVGTGSQISCWVGKYDPLSKVETRPYVDGGYLLSGSPLCGGRSYALLKTFFQSFLEEAGFTSDQVYGVMNRLAERHIALDDPLDVQTSFCGSRQDPSLRGSIQNIGVDNFTPAHLTVGFLQGCVNELYETYLQILPMLETPPQCLVGSGNGLRKNPVLQKLFEKTFGIKLMIPCHMEEAAYGAALFAMICSMPDRDPQSIRELIQYC